MRESLAIKQDVKESCLHLLPRAIKIRFPLLKNAARTHGHAHNFYD